MDQIKAVFNPYKYGETIEVTPTGNSQYAIKKWFTIGRNAKELVYVMPDGRTTYNTDDGERVGFFKFVSDKANDFYSGTLYAAKLTQKSAENGGSFDISWVSLGSANQDELANMAGKLHFNFIPIAFFLRKETNQKSVQKFPSRQLEILSDFQHC